MAPHRKTPRKIDGDDIVIVPASPGPIVQLSTKSRHRDEIDDLLDDVFGAVDDSGPGTADAVLLGGGATAVVAAKLAALPVVVTLGGFGAIALGAILPTRSLYRRLVAKRKEKSAASLIGDGTLLDTGHPLVLELVDAYQQVLTYAASGSEAQRLRTNGVAHALLEEVTTLLTGHRLVDGAETAYVAARLDAMRTLAEAFVEPQTEIAVDRRAEIAARLEVEASAGSSTIDDANDLARDLSIDRDL